MQESRISLDAAIAATGLSKRTLWRRVSEGSLRKVAMDGRGRAMLAASEVLAMLRLSLSAEDAQLMSAADAGDRLAQTEIGAVFHAAHQRSAAVYWWSLAAEQGEPDAMQHLGRCYAGGEGVEKNDGLAVMWIGRAAAAGHAIAIEQLRGFLRARTAMRG